MRTWIKDPLAILAEAAERGIVVEDGRIAETVARGAEPRTPVDADLRRLAPCRAARARQHPPSFLPDADPRPPGGDQPRAVRLADRALSDLGAAEAARAAPGGAAGAGRAAAVRLHHRRRPSLSLSRRAGERRRHRGRGGARARHAHDGDARLDEPLAEGRRPAARLRGAGRGHDPRRQRARAEAVPRSQARRA